jgi:tetratricopeptide (TPR) repeat protein
VFAGELACDELNEEQEIAEADMRVTLMTLAVLLLLVSACQSTMSVEEAKKLTASFGDRPLVPPPRTVNDITAILDQQKRDKPELAAEALTRAAERPPESTDPKTLAQFYRRRGKAARAAGRVGQAIQDLTRAAEYAAEFRDRSDLELWILYELARAEFSGGSHSRGLEYLQRAIGRVGDNQRGWLIPLYGNLAREAAGRFDLELAERAMLETVKVRNEALRWNVKPEWTARYDFHAETAQAAVHELKGQLAEAETFWRQSIATLMNESATSNSGWIDVNTGRLAWVLMKQGRFLEAEVEARKAVLGALRKHGRYSSSTANQANNLLEGTVRARDSGTGRVTVETIIGIVEGFAVSDLAPGSRCTASVRPENARLVPALPSERNWLRGRIAFSAYLGSILRYDVEAEGGLVFKVDITDPWHHQELDLGKEVFVAFPPSGTLVIPA